MQLSHRPLPLLDLKTPPAQQFFAMISDLVVFVNADLRVYCANEALLKLLGYPLDELVDRPFLELIHPDDQVDALATAKRLLVGHGTVQDYRVRLRCRNGHYKSSTWSGTFDKQSKMLYGVGRDLVDHAAKSQHHLDSLVAYDAVITTNGRGQVVAWNSSAEAMFGYSAEEMVGQSLDPIMPTYYHNDHHEIFRQMGNGDGKARRIHELIGLRRDGTEFPMELSVASWEAADGRFFTAIIRDISERRKAERQALDLVIEQERVAVLSNFIQHASHEFRTPLAVIELALHVLQRAEIGDMQRRQVDKIGKQSDHILKLVNGLVMMAKLDSQRALEIKPVHAAALLMEVVDYAAHHITAKQQTIERDIQVGRLVLQGDGYWLERALEELLNNAICFTPEGGHISLRAALSQADKLLVVEVEDDGVGVAPQDRSRIFERFYRSDMAQSSSGLGLGLGMVNKIVDFHGGTVEVMAGQGGQGSLFRVALPLE